MFIFKSGKIFFKSSKKKQFHKRLSFIRLTNPLTTKLRCMREHTTLTQYLKLKMNC